MASIEYFKHQAKLLLKDYNSSKEYNFDQKSVFYEEPQEHFDIKNVFLKAHKTIGVSLSLMNAQHLIAKISDFNEWADLLHTTDAQREIGALKINAYKIGMDPSIVEEARQLVMYELIAAYGDKSSSFDYTDEEELRTWRSVLVRLLEMYYL